MHILLIIIFIGLIGCVPDKVRTKPPALIATKDNLIFESLFENPQSGWNSWQGGDWNGVEASNANSITRSTDQFRGGKYSSKFVLNIGDAVIRNNKQRAELTDWDGRMIEVRSERWYGLSIFLPESYVSDPCEEQLFQWHGVNTVDLDGVNMSNSPIAMYTKNGRWEFGIRFADKFDLGVYDKNRWTDWVLHIKFSPSSDGLVEIWKNGQKILTTTGKNTYNDVVGNYFKIGIYKYGWADGYFSNTVSRTLYYDEIRIGDENSSYSEVAPLSKH
jgi:hypothetical protein